MFDAIDYLKSFALGSAVFLMFVSPILFAAAVSIFPGNKPARKFMFSVVCGVLAYGSTFLTWILLSPFDMVATFLAPMWEDQGYVAVPAFFALVAESAEIVSLVVGILVAVSVPIYLRRSLWSRIFPNAA
jgi:hypothetical protein